MCSTISIQIVADKKLSDYGTLIPCYNPIRKDLSIVANGIISGGLSLDWFIDNFCSAEKEEAGERRITIYDVLDEKIRDIPLGSHGLIFLPYLQGGSRAHGDPNMKGGFYGLTIAADKITMYKSIYEGIAYNLRYILEDFQKKGVTVKKLVAGGGGDKETFLQIISDVTGLPIQRTKKNESASLGSAMIAAVGAGIYSSLQEARSNMLEGNGIIKPKTENHRLYEPFYRRYLELHKQGAVY